MAGDNVVFKRILVDNLVELYGFPKVSAMTFFPAPDATTIFMRLPDQFPESGRLGGCQPGWT